MRAELAELFLEAYRQGKRRTPRRIDLERMGMQNVGAIAALDLNGLCQSQLELLEALTVEQRCHRAAKKRGLMSRTWRVAIDCLERDGLVRQFMGSRGKQRVRCAEVTQAGWLVLLGKKRARRVRTGSRLASREK